VGLGRSFYNVFLQSTVRRVRAQHWRLPSVQGLPYCPLPCEFFRVRDGESAYASEPYLCYGLVEC